MKKFKTIDIYISIVLIVFFLILSLIKRNSTFFVGYFVVGAWQVISMIVHVVKKWFTQKGGVRFVYHWITLISLVTIPIGSFWILLFTAPFMAVFYTWICYKEIYVKMVRPLDQLK
ncbi:hypothetical protein LK994_02440 [Ferruginibacter lapsinanis]|uniref:hypothetical protein n=1 Tax=Ferruginibacter lapsinanis TaxID=563172 RepID=UPI001E40C864|nr:hypothetical protein [Ferruginibacter lapsinanis]UEG50333.1 hypothetical protein LK994_02440 [Ferruginibacter lapsinanis]